ncbi:Golgin candidate 6 [Capsicum chinense]|nr:Golgin candidate 6 [Capsicum chinense]
MFGPDLVHQAMEKVKMIGDRHKAIQSHQKSYVDMRSRELEFKVRDRVFLKVSPMKGVIWFRKKGKLSPWYVSPYLILKRVGNIAYELELSSNLSSIHPMFHVLILRKYVGEPSLIVPIKDSGILDFLSNKEVPGGIMDQQVHRLRTKDVALEKVLRRNHKFEEATWEAEEDMKSKGMSQPDIFLIFIKGFVWTTVGMGGVSIDIGISIGIGINGDGIILGDIVIDGATGGDRVVNGDSGCDGVVGGGSSGDGVVRGISGVDKFIDAPLAVFETRNNHHYDHTGFTNFGGRYTPLNWHTMVFSHGKGSQSLRDFPPPSLSYAYKCQECKEKHDRVINPINALTVAIKKLTCKTGLISSKRISDAFTPLEIKRRKKEIFKDFSSLVSTAVFARISRFHGQKGTTEQNVLATINFNVKFTYVLACWEGFAHDSRILNDALKRLHGLQIPQDKYYLVDVGYELRKRLILELPVFFRMSSRVITKARKSELQVLQIELEAPTPTLGGPKPLLHRMVKYLAFASSMSKDRKSNASENVFVQPIILKLLIIWLSDCPNVVQCFLDSCPHLTYLLELVLNPTISVRGLATLLLGECVIYNKSNASGKDAYRIVDTISQKVGLASYFLKFDEMQKSYLFTSAKPFLPHKPLTRSNVTSMAEIEDGENKSSNQKNKHPMLTSVFDSQFIYFFEALTR